MLYLSSKHFFMNNISHTLSNWSYERISEFEMRVK